MSQPRAPDPGAGPSHRTIVLAVVAAIVLVIGGLAVLSGGGGDRPKATAVEKPELAPVVGLRASLDPGSDVIVFWREIASEDSFGRGEPYVDSFEVTASAGHKGKGAITGEQVFTRLSHIPKSKVTNAWVRDARPDVPLERWSGEVVKGTADEILTGFVRTDAKGRSVMFVDVELAPADPDPEVEGQPAAE